MISFVIDVNNIGNVEWIQWKCKSNCEYSKTCTIADHREQCFTYFYLYTDNFVFFVFFKFFYGKKILQN